MQFHGLIFAALISAVNINAVPTGIPDRVSPIWNQDTDPIPTSPYYLVDKWGIPCTERAKWQHVCRPGKEQGWRGGRCVEGPVRVAYWPKSKPVPKLRKIPKCVLFKNII